MDEVWVQGSVMALPPPQGAAASHLRLLFPLSLYVCMYVCMSVSQHFWEICSRIFFLIKLYNISYTFQNI